MAPLLKHRNRDQVGHSSSCLYHPHRHTQRNSPLPLAGPPASETIEARLKKKHSPPILCQPADPSPQYTIDRLQALYDEAYTELRQSIDSYNDSFVAHMRSLESMPNQVILDQESHRTDETSIQDLTDRLAAGSIKDYSSLLEHELKQIGFEDQGACGDLW
ncbi:hypothetical protein CLU79DRAFT_725543 [Phycomyces nitens]|nr:hypothetical protein CLU79DRAFT_725543 [Phycomyces nitens]